MTETAINNCYELAKNMRIDALEMAKKAGKLGTHLGGGFSAIDIIATLYGGILNFKSDNPDWKQRDRFIASKRHCYLASYSVLHQVGIISKEQMLSFCDDGGVLAGYPWKPELGIDFSGGSLGMGLSVGIGMALKCKRYGENYKVFVLLGDGECNEGAIWEGLLSASKYKLDNLVVIIDNNHLQFDGKDEDILPMFPLTDKVKSFGCDTVEVNGHSIDELYKAFNTSHYEKPLAIVAETIKGFGLPSIENKTESHHISLNEKDYEYMMKSIQEGRYDRIQ